MIRNSFLFLLIIISCAGSDTSRDIVVFNKKINGLSFVASRNHVVAETIVPVVNVNANWVTLMPFGFMPNANSASLTFDHERQWWGEKKEGIKQAGKVFQEKGIKRMLKPQIWIRGGTFTGTIHMNSENDWHSFEKNYEAFILSYAEVAASENFELFCIGTELNAFVVARPNFWKQLIVKIKKVYAGKLTYAANWDSYQNATFWKDLDCIGIDAYFPLHTNKTPTVNELKKAWGPIKLEIATFSKKQNKSILFTEFGYRSVDFTAKEPWESNTAGAYNIEAQENALQAIFETFWQESWFEGGFLWKWFDTYEKAGGVGHTGYTVQNKKSELFIKRQFERN